MPSRTPTVWLPSAYHAASHAAWADWLITHVDGEIDRDPYRQVIGRAGIVVGTALHEFQGLAVLEAANAGVRPLVPDARCYISRA